MTTYEAAGVDLQGAERHVARIAQTVTSTWGPNVAGTFGGFATGIRIPDGYTRPLLMMTTDGVGTKLELARRSGRWGGVGHDLVAMCVDDLAAVGARPLGLVDYMAVGALDAERDSAIVASIAEACQKVGAPLLGGETAEHPGVMEPDAVDLAAAALGVLEEGTGIGPHKVSPGDTIVGLLSPNLRSNGFSLIRKLFGDEMDDHLDVLLEPSVLYCTAVLDTIEEGGVNSAAHITGGGIVENLPRSLPSGLGARIDSSSWEPPPVFGMIADRGVGRGEMFRTFNMGIGFCLVVDAARAGEVISGLGERSATVIGEVTVSDGVEIV
ncbi:MAG TPA: phosphoribosylformylglycinamidine cyclo-ligase [Acidimicrobiia bacterium]|nr:phosphoribosylformylglycinamidine cyclo-ligase [Acidimicrobiia bacterium]